MSESDVLLGMAEIAVALLGFAAIVSVFSQRDDWRPDGRFWAMVTSGIGTLTFSLVPLPLLTGEAVVASARQGVHALFGLWALGYGVFLTTQFRRDRASESAPNFWIFAGVLGGSALAGALLLSTAFRDVGGSAFWPYLGALVWFQLVTAIFFVRLLVVWLR